jgi:hypothetical protein
MVNSLNMTLTLPILPEIELETATPEVAKAQLLELRRSLDEVCKDVDARLRSLEELEGEPTKEPCAAEVATITAEPSMETNDDIYEADSIGASSMETRMVMEATSPTTMSAELEQATLEELNEALAKAFAQMAGRMVW